MLRIHETCLELIRMVAPIAANIGRHDPDLARQLRRALTSVPLNIAEASDQRGARRNNHYALALGSSREALSAIEVAIAWRYIPEPDPLLRQTFDQVIGTLMNVTR
jgi:four helix bundle protein